MFDIRKYQVRQCENLSRFWSLNITIGIYTNVISFRLKLFYYRKKFFCLNKWLSPRKGNSSLCTKIASLLVGKGENILSRHQFSIWIIKRNGIWIVTVQTLKHTSLQKHYKSYPRSILSCESFDRMHINHQLLKNQE